MTACRCSGASSCCSEAFSCPGRIFGAIYAVWDGAEADAATIGWLRTAIDGVAPDCTGAYVGEADLDRPHHPLAWLSPASADRLATLRRRYDPKGVFFRRKRNAAIAAE